jgi:hypothetical protein
VIFHGGAELMEQLADIAQAANIHDFSDDEMTGAANRAALLYGVSSKSMDKQEALAEFDHFLKTQGDQLGQSLGAEGSAGRRGAGRATAAAAARGAVRHGRHRLHHRRHLCRASGKASAAQADQDNKTSLVEAAGAA